MQVFTLKHLRSAMLSFLGDEWVTAGALGVACNPGCVHGGGYTGGRYLSYVTAGKR